jgi:hypothetical protein
LISAASINDGGLKTVYTDSNLSKLQEASKSRVWLVGLAQGGLWAGSFIALNSAWYDGYEKQKFHFFNDWPEWQQMDKAGHVWTAYQIGRFSTEMWRWTGIRNKNALLLGGLSSIAYMSIIEIQDGFSEKWGFSTGDMLMNITGAGMYLAQEIAWKEQRIQVKFSYSPYSYPDNLKDRADDLFGKTSAERILKDYNGQTYWLSANLRSFFPESGIPRWLNLSLGYGAETMLGGTENKWTDENGVVTDRSDIERYRKFLLSVDVDLTKIPVRKKWLKSVFYTLNMIKIPAPALEWNTKGNVKIHGFYF